jgi:hypothetical protein
MHDLHGGHMYSGKRPPEQAVAPATKLSSLVARLPHHGGPMTYTNLFENYFIQ